MEAVMTIRDRFDKHMDILKLYLSEVPATQVKGITDAMYTAYLLGIEDTASGDLTNVIHCDTV